MVFAVLVVIDCGLVSAIVTARVQLHFVRERYGQAGTADSATPFVGYREDGAAVRYDGAQPALAIWYASKTCPYCTRDLEWDKLASQLQQRGVKIVILLPGSGLGFSPLETRPLGAEQAAFADGTWLGRYPLSVTPTLLIFNRDQRLIWYKLGMLTSDDSKGALAALDKAIRRAI
jgi:hypothetical protein